MDTVRSCQRFSSRMPSPPPHPDWDALNITPQKVPNIPSECSCRRRTPPGAFVSWNKDRRGLQDKVCSALRATGSKMFSTCRPGLWGLAAHSRNSFNLFVFKGKAHLGLVVKVLFYWIGNKNNRLSPPNRVPVHFGVRLVKPLTHSRTSEHGGLPGLYLLWAEPPDVPLSVGSDPNLRLPARPATWGASG